MGTFDIKEKQFRQIFEDLTQKLESADDTSTDKKLLASLQDVLEKAEGLVQGMDLDARTGDPVLRPQLLARLREHKIRLLALKKDLRRRAGLSGGGAKSTNSEMSSVLDSESAAGSETSPSEAGSRAGQRDRLLSSTARLEGTSERLGTTRQLALQAEHMGVTILKDLHDQRQSLLHAHDVVHDVDEEISKARHILRVMVAKMNRNKWTVGLIVSLLFAAIAAVMYAKLHH